MGLARADGGRAVEVVWENRGVGEGGRWEVGGGGWGEPWGWRGRTVVGQWRWFGRTVVLARADGGRAVEVVWANRGVGEGGRWWVLHRTERGVGEEKRASLSKFYECAKNIVPLQPQTQHLKRINV